MSTAQIEKLVADFPTIGGKMYQMLMNHLPPREIRSKQMHTAYARVVEALATDIGSDVFDLAERKALETYIGAVAHFIDEYERNVFPRPVVTPEEMLEFFIEQHDLTQTDLRHELGSQSVVSEILNGDRKLNRGQIERLAKRFHVSPATFYSREAA